MRIRIWDRILSALAGLLIALMGIGLFVFAIGVFPIRLDLSGLNGPFQWWQRAFMALIALALLALGAHGLSLLFRRGREKGFIIQHAEHGDMSISMNALESMVKKCVDSHDELSVNATRIYRAHEGIVVEIRVTLMSGVNIPLTVNALQKQIKQYITSCSGVDVHKVRVMVETDTARLAEPEPVSLPAAQADAAPQAQEPPVKRGFADRLFHHQEEPNSYAAPEQDLTVELPAAGPEPASEKAPDIPADEISAQEAPEADEQTVTQEEAAAPLAAEELADHEKENV